MPYEKRRCQEEGSDIEGQSWLGWSPGRQRVGPKADWCFFAGF